MSPTSQGTDGTMHRVFIEGTGFGLPRTTPIAVIWEKDGAEREGHLLFRHDGLLVVIPPGGKWNPLAAGEYTVTVVLDPDGDAESADAAAEDAPADTAKADEAKADAAEGGDAKGEAPKKAPPKKKGTPRKKATRAAARALLSSSTSAHDRRAPWKKSAV